MTKNHLVLLVAGISTYAIITGWASGPAHLGAILNGTPGVSSAGTCSGCHTGGSGTTVINELRFTDDATGMVINDGRYRPGHTYSVVIRASGTGGQDFYGFQVTVRNDANANAGTLIATQQGTGVATAEGFNVIEHVTRLTAASAGTYTPAFKWVAPAAGTGRVTVQAILNAVNGNSTTSGDAVSAPYAIALTEASGTGVSGVTISSGPGVYPNPVAAQLHLRINITGNYQADLYSTTGQHLLQQAIRVTKEGEEISVRVDQFPAGAYYLVLTNETGNQVFPWVKA